MAKMANRSPPAVLMVGTGEYTTGFVGGAQSTSDKKIGVVALVLFDLRRRGLVSALSMAGVSGRKFPGIRQHLHQNISNVYNNLDVSFTSFPNDDTSDPEAYKLAIDSLPKGSAVTIFTPDSTHYGIALYAIRHGCHVLITKPATQTVADHQRLVVESRKAGVFVYVEHHKRFDPAYADARHRAKNTAVLGDFSHFYSYMSQPKSQLETFKAWAGKDSDISYYLNSHHVDVCESMVRDAGWRPTRVTASASTGIAESLGCQGGTEDLITLMVEWEQQGQAQGIGQQSRGPRRATSVHTASWTAPQHAGVHSAQRFHYVASQGEIHVDQAKRGYDIAWDDPQSPRQVVWYNPFYMKYAADDEGNFNGQSGYGYLSFEKFIDCVTKLNAGEVTLDQLDGRDLPTLARTVMTTAILDAGRRSLDENGRTLEIVVSKDSGLVELR